MKITADMVKNLRVKTGAGILDSKKALLENNGDMKLAEKWLQENGLLKAAKKSERVAAEGVCKVLVKDKDGLILEVNTETDFVAKNSLFIDMINKISDEIIIKKPSTLEESLKLVLKDGKTIEETIKSNIAIIGENITLRRFEILKANDDDEALGSYIHAGGNIGVITKIKGNNPEIQTIADDIAMHIAGMSPISVSIEEIDKEIENTKRNEFTKDTLKEGKPQNIVNKIVDGKMSKYFSDVVLLEQNYVNDTNIKVKDFLKKSSLEVCEFIRYRVGEGIEKENIDFAEEVRQQMR